MSDLKAFNVQSRRAVLSLRGVGSKLGVIRRTLGEAAPAELDEAIAAVAAAGDALNATETAPTAKKATRSAPKADADGEKKTPKKRATRKTSTKEK